MHDDRLEQERAEILQRYRKLVAACRPGSTKENKETLRKAFEFAVDAHKNHRRKSGEPYIYHPIAVAQIVAQEIGLGTTSLVCALLHDVVEDTDYTLGDISERFGEEVARVIDGLTKISDIFDQTTSVQAENFRKMLLTLSDDVRVILIKLADRLHNMRTLESLPPKKQLKVANETLYLFAPLAHRLGFHAIKSELEDLALKYIDPDIFNAISQKLIESEEERNRFISSFIQPIKKTLKEEEFKYTILARTKSISSIWGKMQKKEIPFEEVYDIFAIRIIIDTPEQREKADAWKAYSIVTDFYKPNPDRLRDWLSTPKANGYESLHTTVMSRTGKWVEVQIRSKRMDEIAEKGYAAHWKYKESKAGESGLDKWLRRIREILKTPESDALDFIEEFKLNLFSDEIFVFTPKGELRTLPMDSTALDFAYSIHSEVGNHCLGAKVNHKLVPLSHVLKSGDQVEIITSQKQSPKPDWLHYVTTARAKGRIKTALKETRKKQAENGKEILERKLKALKLDNNPAIIQKLVDHFKLPSPLDLYYEVAIEKIGQKELKAYQTDTEKGGILSYLKNPFGRSRDSTPTEKTPEKDPIREQLKSKPDTLLIGDSLENLTYTLSPCCNPIPGDDVFGFVTINEGIKIHRNNCPNATQLLSKYAYRIVKAKWITNKSIAFLSGIRLKGIDEFGLLRNITNVISSELNINIRTINIETNAGTFEGSVMLYINDTQHLNNLINKLKKIKGVESVSRIGKM
ncbi:MAG TPA: bifunctional (p)ppGpp synthetase/guanosine-3',5'-bis(diphosphate) 3'-pyrophosphohydrolase [Bacteroidales bacterium]|nr:bifunctional (p)ppGpp synthetase/guanosine-3',5'-bis(diphosphate) 3'-pyrophosphohydrolase [Bacteroidales bacterium]